MRATERVCARTNGRQIARCDAVAPAHGGGDALLLCFPYCWFLRRRGQRRMTCWRRSWQRLSCNDATRRRDAARGRRKETESEGNATDRQNGWVNGKEQRRKLGAEGKQAASEGPSEQQPSRPLEILARATSSSSMNTDEQRTHQRTISCPLPLLSSPAPVPCVVSCVCGAVRRQAHARWRG
jgi:hypothetical protein